MTLIAIIGDGFWILALSLIASAAWQTRARLEPAARVPLPWGLGRLGLAWPRDAALALSVLLPFALGALLLVMGRSAALADSALLTALVRIFLAGVVAWLQVGWLRSVLYSQP